MRRHAAQSKYYEFYVKISRVMDEFIFKIECDRYCQDVVIDYDSVNALPEISTDVSCTLYCFYFDTE